MDNTSNENGQEMDPEAAQAMEWNDEASEATPEDIFGNPVILNQILEQLPNSKLLELSLVSKLWKKEARIVMKNRGNIMAFLNCDGTRGCGQVFQAFAANLETLNETLYSGMTISLSTMDDCERTGALEVERIHESILAGMRGKLKRLSIQLDDPEVCWKKRACPNHLLLRLLLRDFIGDLEHLTIKIEDAMEPFIEQFLPDGPYPRLKVLKLEDLRGDLEEETFGNQIRLLLSRAPNLQQIHTDGVLSLRENLMEGREGVVHVHDGSVDNPVHDIPEYVIPALRLKRLRLFYTTEPEQSLDRFNGKAQNLLRTCCATTLETLSLDTVSLVLLMSYGIQLVNVNNLIIFFDYLELEECDPRIINILSRLDLTYLFPTLKKVSMTSMGLCNRVELSRDVRDAIVEQANALRAEPTLPRAGNLKFLNLLHHSVPLRAVQFFAHMFPAIEKLVVGTSDNIFPVESAWELWPDLQLMKVSGESYQRP